MNEDVGRIDTKAKQVLAQTLPTAEESGKMDAAPESQGPDWETDLDVYPLREKAEDPRWAVRTVWIWVGFALVSIAFILTLLILGAIYD